MSPRDTDHSVETQRIAAGGAVAAALVVVCGFVIAWSAFTMLSAALVETPAVLESERSGGAGGEDRLALYVDQFNGRSMFFTPAEPPPVKVESPPSNEPGPRVDPTPTRYSGPKVIGMANDTVWFSDKRQAKVAGEAVGDLRVLSTDGAWQILVEWKGVEFDVPFMIRDEYVLPPLPDSGRAGGDAGSEIAAAPLGKGNGSGEVRSDVTEETEQENPGSRDNSQSGDEQ